jgi:hypothetical protein
MAAGSTYHSHVAGGTTATLPRMAALGRKQVEAYVAGRELRNLVHPADRSG